jgi:mannose-1-phosphate guanylyltransferase
VLTRPIIVLTEQVAGRIIVPGSGRLVVCLGMDDLVIVDMPNCNTPSWALS